MKTPLLVAFVALTAVPALALADDADQPISKSAPPTSIGKVDPCAALAKAGENPLDEKAKCKKVASKKIDGVGTATVYAIKSDDGAVARYGLVIDGQLAPPVDLMSDCAMGGKCDNVRKVTPKLRVISVGGQPAVALDLKTKYTHDTTDMETGKPNGSTPWLRYDFVVCGKDAAGKLACVTSGFGDAYNHCTASLDPGGIVIHACDEQTEIKL